MTTTPTIPDATAAPGTTFVTVAIPYVNAAPHLGYAYELVAGRHLRPRPAGRRRRRPLPRRHRRLRAQERARRRGRRACRRRELVAGNAAAVRRPRANRSASSFDDFIRTSADPRHGRRSSGCGGRCAAAGDLYRRTYEGDVLRRLRAFYTADEPSTADCPEHGTRARAGRRGELVLPPVPATERRSSVSSRRASSRCGPTAVPRRGAGVRARRARRHQRVALRAAGRAAGASACPDDPTQVIYVWFDALTNYLTVARLRRPGQRALPALVGAAPTAGCT